MASSHMMASHLSIDLQQAIVYVRYRPGNWYVSISCGQHGPPEQTSTIQGMESGGATELVWNENKQLNVQFHQTYEIWLRVYRDGEWLCTAIVPLKEGNQESDSYGLKMSPDHTCGSVMLNYTWSSGPQIRSKAPDISYTPPSYPSKNSRWNRVPPEHRNQSVDPISAGSMQQSHVPGQNHAYTNTPTTPLAARPYQQIVTSQPQYPPPQPTATYYRPQPPPTGNQHGGTYLSGGNNQHGRGANQCAPGTGGNQNSAGHQHTGGWLNQRGNQHGQ